MGGAWRPLAGSVNMKIMTGKQSAFVQFPSEQEAEVAMAAFMSRACSSAEYSKNPLGKRSRDY